MKEEELETPDVSAEQSADAGEVTDEQIWDELDAEEAEGADSDDAEDADEFNDADEPEATEPEAEDTSTDDDDDTEDSDGKSDDPPEVDLQEQINRLEQSVRSEKGRAASAYKKLNALKAQIAQANANSLDDTDNDSSSKLDEAQEEYGEVVGPLIEELRELKGQVRSLRESDAGQVKVLESQISAITSGETDVFLQEHPDGLEFANENAAEIAKWVDDQPRFVRDIYAQNEHEIVDGKGAAYVFSLFKKARTAQSDTGGDSSESNRLADKREAQLDGSKSPKNRSARVKASDIPPDVDDEDALWESWEEHDRRKGLTV